jgi:hypothetical protein
MADGTGKALGTLSGNEPAGGRELAERVEEKPEERAEERAPARQGQAETSPAVDAGRLRELVLRAHPEAIPELVQGETLEELEASAKLASEVYRRIAESVREAVAREAAGSIPAGQPGRQTFLVNIEALSPAAKIAEGLRRVRSE